jgi:hypothetical protein
MKRQVVFCVTAGITGYRVVKNDVEISNNGSEQ